MRLQDKVALVTGGSSGIGEATASLFAKEGAKIAITGRNEKRGNAVTEQITKNGGHAVFISSDVRKSSDCQLAVDEILRAFGRIDILFNNAGVFYPHTTLDCSEEEWDEQIDINLKGTFLMSKAVLPHMVQRHSGVIINNSSGWGIVGGDAAVAYCASKGGVVLLTKAMAMDQQIESLSSQGTFSSSPASRNSWSTGVLHRILAWLPEWRVCMNRIVLWALLMTTTMLAA